MEALGCGTGMQLLEYTVEPKPQTVRVTSAKHVVDDITATPVSADDIRQLAGQGEAQRRGRRGLLRQLAAQGEAPLAERRDRRDDVDIAMARRQRRACILSSVGQGSAASAPQPGQGSAASAPQLWQPKTTWCPWILPSALPSVPVAAIGTTLFVCT